MSKIQKDFEKLLNDKVDKNFILPEFTKKLADKLLNRIKKIKLYSQGYAFTLNFIHENFTAKDHLIFADKFNLSGIDLHINNGEKVQLINMNKSELTKIKKLAKKLNIKIILEISTTKKEQVNKVVEIARVLEVKHIRVYSMHEGKLRDCIKNCIKDLKYACKLAEKYNLYFSIEPHEAMKSNELVQIVNKVNSKKLSILYDFGNMINSNEKPLPSLIKMAPYIEWAHIKDVNIKKDGKGFGQQGVKDGTGDLPQIRQIYELLMLGQKVPQVKFFSLQQVNGYLSPAYRFKNEGINPIIPPRSESIKKEDKKISIIKNLQIEKKNAIQQVIYIKKLLDKLNKLCERRLSMKK